MYAFEDGLDYQKTQAKESVCVCLCISMKQEVWWLLGLMLDAVRCYLITLDNHGSVSWLDLDVIFYFISF